MLKKYVDGLVPQVRRSWLPVLIGVGVFLGYGQVGRLIGEADQGLAAGAGLGLVGLCLLLGHYLRFWQPFKALKNLWTLVYVSAGLLGALTCNIIGGLILVLLHGPGATSANQQAILDANIPPVLLFITVVIMAPVVEEFLLRGIIMDKVFGLQSWLGLAVSSFIFAYLHGPTDAPSWFIYGGMGLALGLTYRFSRRLDLAITVHLLNNLIAFVTIMVQLSR